MKKILLLLLVLGLVIGLTGVVSATGEETTPADVLKDEPVTEDGTSGTPDNTPVPEKPVASFTASETSGHAPLEVTFTNTSTGNPTSFKWDFDDGNNSADQNPKHTFAKARKYKVSLTVANGSVTSEAYVKEITVTEKPGQVPETEIEVDPTTGLAPLNVTFNATATNAESVKWEFGDGKDATTKDTTHIHEKPGMYVANFTATNANGTSEKKIKNHHGKRRYIHLQGCN